MEHNRIRSHQRNVLPPGSPRSPNDRAGPRSRNSPLHDRDFFNRTGGTVRGKYAPRLGVSGNLRTRLPPSPAPSDTPPSVASDAWSDTQFNPDSRCQSPASSATSLEEDCQPNVPERLLAKRISPSPLTEPPETYSESPSCSLTSESSDVHLLFEPNLASAIAEKSSPPSPMPAMVHSNFFPINFDTLSETSSEMEPNALNSFEQPRLAIGNTVLPDPKERVRHWLQPSHNPDVAPHGSSETSPDHHTKEEYPATETACKDSCSSDVDDDSILPECDVQRPSKNRKMHIPMETDPRDCGPNSTTIASLPERILAMIMSFCIEPKDLLVLIRSSPVFLQPFCKSRVTIVSPMIKHMRFRFGGDMPRTGLIAAKLQNMQSKGAAISSVRQASARRVVQSILSFSPKGPLLHPSYSLRQLRLISDALGKAETVMSSYTDCAWENLNAVSKLGTSEISEEPVLSRTERKQFMDTFCLYDAYCTVFFSENAISADGDTAVWHSLLEEDGISCEIPKRFYSIMTYLYDLYRDWIYMAIEKRYDDIPALEKQIDPLIEYLICSGPNVLQALQDMGASERYRYLFELLNLCETNAAFRRKISFVLGRGYKLLWPYREIAAGLTKEEVLTAEHFWDKATLYRVGYISKVHLNLPCQALSAGISYQPQVSTANNTSSPQLRHQYHDD
ncbi:uncharacterized protein FTJAE_6882 [Fusarium tjaetaba]|uniref:Uncharacterized protein n=1 Tax=Fusarium tjaetaba TaxID=1567544 RepID=A0A8H5RIV5_9HYPO|nr:uncharacterized protein FTJAE_6882 [Fusarium tjaetaba]KAF5633988.1 hypothetical protein FTJAE_6882 [Fusarium tjaetaba]